MAERRARPRRDETDPAELRRLVAWYAGIADDYRAAAAEAENATKGVELRRLEADASQRAVEFRAQLRKAGLP